VTKVIKASKDIFALIINLWLLPSYDVFEIGMLSQKEFQKTRVQNEKTKRKHLYKYINMYVLIVSTFSSKRNIHKTIVPCIQEPIIRS
jgi:hypothetical protein